MLANSLVKGWVRHKRYTPKTNQFDYDMDWTLLDLDTVDKEFAKSRLWSVEKRNIISYRGKDFHCGLKSSNQENSHGNSSRGNPWHEHSSRDNSKKSGSELNKAAIKQTIKQQSGQTFEGKIFMMSHLRSYGYNFNSVCFYFCYEKSKLRYIISEITNTPWGERHSYVFDCAKSIERDSIHQFEFSKEFHVSPFIQMDMKYRWTFKVSNDSLRVHMNVLDDAGTKYFDATFTGDLLPLTPKLMNQFAWKYAFQPLKMTLTIYWQAFKLWLKRITVQDHPKHSNQRSS